jgi:hypothetical protein
MILKKSAVLKTLAISFALGCILLASSAITMGATLTVGNATSLPCAGTYPTISAAVAAAASGDTIQVCPGAYNESVTINKPLTLLGAKAGVDARTRATTGESIINSSCSPVQIFADNVVLDGFTVQGSTDLDPCTIAGIYTNPGGFGYDGGYQIRNNIVQNNIIGIEMDNTGVLPAKVEHNLIRNNNNPGPDGGTGIDTNFGANKVTVNANKFVGNTNSAIGNFGGGSNLTFSNNEFDANRRAIGVFAVTSSTITGNLMHNSTDPATADIRFFGGVTGVAITCNTLTNGAGRGIRIDDECPGCPNSSITINNNNISGYPVAGLQVDTLSYAGGPASLDATNNWWGSATGPTIATNPGGTGEAIIDPDGVVKYSPFRSTFSSCAPVPQIGPPTNKDQCKNEGWKSFNTPRSFKNQGDCIQYVNTGK